MSNNLQCQYVLVVFNNECFKHAEEHSKLDLFFNIFLPAIYLDTFSYANTLCVMFWRQIVTHIMI